MAERLTTSGYMATVVAGHPLSGSEGRVYVHRLRLFESIGYGPHWCHWCGRPISWRARRRNSQVIADHVDENKVNNDPQNLVASCHPCNVRRAHDRPRRPPPPCGSRAAYVWHGRHGTKPCPPCREANTTYLRAYKAQRAAECDGTGTKRDES